jgi:hypothetical protein
VLVGHWTLDEASGIVSDSAGPPFTNSTNSIGSGNYLQPSPATGIYGNYVLKPADAATLGASLNIPTNESFSLGSAVGSDLNLTNNFTAMAWVNPNSTSGKHMVFGTGQGGQNGWKFGANDNRLEFTSNGSADATVPTSTFAVPSGEYFHYAITVGGGMVEFFINGESVTSLGSGTVSLSNATDMFLGNQAVSGGENWDGLIDDLRIYNTILSAEEIRSAAGLSNVPVPEPSALLLASLGLVGCITGQRRRSNRA